MNKFTSLQGLAKSRVNVLGHAEKLTAKYLAIALSAALLPACGGTAAVSSVAAVSSAPVVSSIAAVSSAPAVSSMAAVSSVPVVSSIAAVSSAPVVSSIPAVSSSVVASSSSVAVMVGGPGTENTILKSTGEFSSGIEKFTTYIDTADLASITWDKSAKVTINKTSTQPWNVQVIHETSIQAGLTYTLCYDAYAESNRDIEVDIDSGPDADTAKAYKSVVSGATTAVLSTNLTRFKHTFTASATDDTARVLFSLGISDADVTLDNIGLYQGTACNVKSTAPVVTPPVTPPVTSTTSPGCGKNPGQLGSANSPLNIGPSTNKYYVTLPNNYDKNKPYNVVFVHHPSGSTTGITWGATGANFPAEAKANAIFVYPQTRNGSSGWLGNDFSMFEPLYNKITDEFCVNKGGVFATGYSSGGDYSGMIGCEHGDKITAIAPTNTKPVGQYPLTVPTKRTCKGNVKAIIFHNPKDTLVGTTNGKDMVNFYRSINGCGTTTVPYPGYNTEGQKCVTYQGCKAGAEVTYCEHNASYGNPRTEHGYPSFTGPLFWDVIKTYK